MQKMLHFVGLSKTIQGIFGLVAWISSTHLGFITQASETGLSSNKKYTFQENQAKLCRIQDV